MDKLNLNKGDTAYLVYSGRNGRKIEEVSVRMKRSYANGGATYFLVRKNGTRPLRSYNEYGHPNFKDFTDAALCFVSSALFETRVEAEKFLKF